jgi:hydrogenase maturation protease
MAAPAPLLVLGVGNPSRGDDALGPLFIEGLSEVLATEVSSGVLELLTDYQLQIEHALDLTGRSRVVFVDASVRATPPFEYSRTRAHAGRACSTHAISPEEVLAAHRRVVGEPPESWVLAIRGEHFELGDGLSSGARAHLDAALEFFVAEARGRGGERVGRRIDIEGIVQGVGFRPWVYRMARELGLGGEVNNTPNGVSIEAFGSGRALDALLRAIQTRAPAAARVRSVRTTPIEARERRTFQIVPSARDGVATLSLPPSACASSAIQATVTTAMSSRAARRVVLDFPSPLRCPTTAPRRAWPPSGRVRTALANTRSSRTAVFTRRRSLARLVGRACGSRTARARHCPVPIHWRRPSSC